MYYIKTLITIILVISTMTAAASGLVFLFGSEERKNQLKDWWSERPWKEK